MYQIEAPALNQDDEEPYQPVQNGFRWSQPSKQGLLSHVFTEPGVFYYSDQNFQEAAEYIGTVIVKPKPKEHRVMITENGFDPSTVNKSVLQCTFISSYCKEYMYPAYDLRININEHIP